MPDDKMFSRTSAPRAQIIAVGSELLTPDRVDTNSLFLTRELNRLGIQVERKLVVGDDPEQISMAVRQALQSAQVLLMTGGLGPTTDDITREVVSQVLKRPLHFDSSVMGEIETRAFRFGFRLGENNRRQAQVPEGATVLPNPRGTAPGLFLSTGSCSLFLLPGPPVELEPMFREQVLKHLRGQTTDTQLWSRQLRIASLSESAVDERVAPLYRRYEGIDTTILSSPGIIDLHFSCSGESASQESVERLNSLIRDIREEMGSAVFADSNQPLEAALGDLLVERGLVIATAESCTGGLVAKMLTDTPGSSGFFSGAVVAYNNDVKRSVLGVSSDTLSKWGSVSAQVAREMALKVRSRMDASASIALTGVAGPQGGSDAKPVGLVFVAISVHDRIKVKERLFPGDREAIRLRSARFGMDWLRREIL